MKTQRRLSPSRIIAYVALSFLTAILVCLGVWQVERLSWKHALIARVDARVHAAPVAPPAQAQWKTVSAEGDEYRRVTMRGLFENDRESLVYASTALGPGYWVMTPLRLSDNTAIIVNRGFVTLDKKNPLARQAGQIVSAASITGLIRMSEPKGSLLRSNDPCTGRWYSRDVAAIAQNNGIENAAPFFVDADDTPNPGGWPVGELTVIDFPNNHLVYAITWFVLALMAAGLLVIMVRTAKARHDDDRLAIP